MVDHSKYNISTGYSFRHINNTQLHVFVLCVVCCVRIGVPALFIHPKPPRMAAVFSVHYNLHDFFISTSIASFASSILPQCHRLPAYA